MRKALWLFVAAGMLFGLAGTATAEPSGDWQQKYEELLKRVQVLEAQKTDAQLSAAQREEVLKLVDELNKDAATRSGLPDWLENFTLYGDLRLRWQTNCYNTNKKNRNRARFRIRVGGKKTWWDKQLEVGFRLASGADDEPTSTNQSFDTHFSEKSVGWDLAYAKFQPTSLPGFTIIGGKFKIPWVHTDILWDSDVNPEGAWAQYLHKCSNSFQGFVNAGYFFVEEESGHPDVTMWMGQVGFIWEIMKDVKWTVAATWYDYENLEENYFNSDGNHVMPAGFLAAEDFSIINLTTKVGFKVGGIPMSAYFDWASNCTDEDSYWGYDDQSSACAVGFKVGENKKKGDWSFSIKYAYIEANAVVGQFADADFGSSNRKGLVWRAKYNLDKFLTVGGAVFYTEPVTGSAQDDTNTTVQIDMIWKF